MLIIIDAQVDFFDGGALAVANSKQIIPKLQQLLSHCNNCIISQDWHPKDHLSFASNHKGKEVFDRISIAGSQQILWPDHCIQGSDGAKIHPDLDTSKADIILRKGYNKNIDSYSIFFENDFKTNTGLEGYLKSREIKEIFIAGLALDYCVAWSALDGQKLGFKTTILTDASAYISREEYEKKMKELMKAHIGFSLVDEYIKRKAD